MYAPLHLVGKMSHIKASGDMRLLNLAGETIFVQEITENATELTRQPGEISEE